MSKSIFKLRFYALLALSLFTLSSKTATADCDPYFLPPHEVLNRVILSNGFNAKITQKIIRDRPDIAMSIFNSTREGKTQSAKAIKLYRGLAVQPKDFKFKLGDASKLPGTFTAYMGVSFFSPNLEYSLSYAKGFTAKNGSKTGIIVEYELPSLMFMKRKRLLDDVAINYEESITEKMMPDDRPFISRIGVIDNSSAESSGVDQIKWYDYEEIFKNGVPENPDH